MTDNKTLIPCSNCGRELFSDGIDTTTTVPRDFEFAGQQAELEVPAKECRECGEVTPL